MGENLSPALPLRSIAAYLIPTETRYVEVLWVIDTRGELWRYDGETGWDRRLALTPDEEKAA